MTQKNRNIGLKISLLANLLLLALLLVLYVVPQIKYSFLSPESEQASNAILSNYVEPPQTEWHDNIVIDTIKVEKTCLIDALFYNLSVEYPQISGLSDIVFQKQLNATFFINTSCSGGVEVIREDAIEEIIAKENITREDFLYWEYDGGGDYSSFYVGTNNNGILSIIQFFETAAGSGSNVYSRSHRVTNCDLVNRKYLSNSDIRGDRNIDFLNERIKAHFKSSGEYYDCPECLPIIGQDISFDKVSFFIENDSIKLAMTADILGRDRTYLIPIDKWDRR
ncbi:hypothetical protein AGMMS4956_03970 [Bacteroidia bacterium]|nr:hypothetical protein AGMMS4956_03970 [Bacteroidia bacterium]